MSSFTQDDPRFIGEKSGPYTPGKLWENVEVAVRKMWRLCIQTRWQEKKLLKTLKRDFWMILDHVKVVQIDIKWYNFASHLETLRLGLGRWIHVEKRSTATAGLVVKKCLGGNLNLRDVPVGMRCYCWWFRNPANQLRLVVYPIIHRVFIHPKWCRISSINSISRVHHIVQIPFAVVLLLHQFSIHLTSFFLYRLKQRNKKKQMYGFQTWNLMVPSVYKWLAINWMMDQIIA